jgi:nucleoside-diphosphate-sugar epimerase
MIRKSTIANRHAMSMSSTGLILGCGYLGARVACLWRQQNRHVFAATRNATHLPSDVEPILCDVLQPASLRTLPQVETVLYAIGFDRTSGASMRAVYVDGLANVLAHLPAPQRFIYISSSSVYGQTDGGWVDECSATEPEEVSGQVVLEAEAVLRAKLQGAVVLRFAGIYGPGRLLRRQRIEQGELIVGDADKWLNLIHVEDGARVVLAAEQRGQAGRVYNVCDDHPVRRRYFYATLARVLGAPEPHFASPPADQPTPPHEKAHRRINNRRMKEELQVELRYPDYEQGLRASV